MELALKDEQDTLTVSEAIFDSDFNEALVYQVIVAYAANIRRGTCAQKTRAQVSGSGKKPWRQKGTGRARSGSIRSPIWRSGGVTFAACPQNYNQKINKKMYRNALKSIFSELLRQDRLIFVKDFSIESPKTKLLARKIKDMSLENVLIITSNKDVNLFMAARNMHKVNVRDIVSIDPVTLIIFDKVIMTVEAVKKMEDTLT